MKKRIIEEKSLAFGIRISKMVRYLSNKYPNNFQIRDYLHQINRCGTSIGANVHEGSYAQSTLDYTSKHSIALKEASETKFWLDVLFNGKYLTQSEYDSMVKDVTEIIKILTKLIKTSKGC